MRLRWYSVVVDAHDVSAQARWWADVLDWQVLFDTPDEAVIIPRDLPEEYIGGPIPAASWHRIGPGMVFVPVPEEKQVKNRLHIDLAPHLEDDRDAQIRRLLERGATLADVGQDDAEDEVSWTVLRDPEGNEFCVLSSRDL